MSTIPAPEPRHPIDLPKYSPLCGALKDPKTPTNLGPYSK